MRAVNLIPADQRSSGSVGAGRSGGGAYAVLAAFAGIALMALLYGLAHHDYNSGQKEAADYSAKAQQAQSEVSSLTPYTSFVAMRHQRAEAVESLVNARFDWAHTFHEFARVLPSDASITSLTGTVGETGGPGSEKTKGAPNPATSTESAGGAPTTTAKAAATAVTPATPAGSIPVFTVQGCATTQKAVANTIDRLRLIDGVASVELQSSTAANTPSGGSSSAGGCPNKAPAYVLKVTFQPLPTSSEIVSTAKASTVADTTKGAKR